MAIINGEEIVIQTPNLRIAGKKWGDSLGLPVLGIHGFFDNAASFDLLAPVLPDVLFVAIDLPGHGFSEHRPKGSFYNFFDYVADVCAVVDKLEWDSFALIGHSMGAAISSLVAGTIPDRVSHLVLLDGIDVPVFGQPAMLPRNLQDSIRRMDAIQANNHAVYKNMEELVKVRCSSGELREEFVGLLTDWGVT